MILQHISAIQFKNLHEVALEFDPQVNGIAGANAQGKTNLLEAIYSLGYGKGYFSTADSQNIEHGQAFFLLQAILQDDQDEAIRLHLGLKKGHKKVLKKNDKEYERLADHIGLMPAVMISPYDSDLIHGGSEIRRRFMDAVLCTNSPPYLNALIRYQQALKNRNRLLKEMRGRTPDPQLMEAWDEQMHRWAEEIGKARTKFIADFAPIFQRYYGDVSGSSEEAECLLHWGWDSTEGLMTGLQRSWEKDRVLQHTTVGPHRDDLRFMIDAQPARRFGSQGQQKSFLIALKLAKAAIIREATGKRPLLLLDDIFDKLDHHRVGNLMHALTEEPVGQIFVTHTEIDHLQDVFKGRGRYFSVEGGNFRAL